MSDPDSAFDAAAFQRLSGATPAQMQDLEAFRAELEIWNTRMNLVGPSAMQAFWKRHAWDSAQLLAFAPGARIWADIGAGAGFPGLVLAILLKASPGAKVHLVESMAKRCRFLAAVVDRLALPAVVHNVRAETLQIAGVEVVAARACAPMSRLLGFAEPLLGTGAIGLFLKGKGVELELQAARKSWRFRADLMPSLSDPSGMVVRIEGLSHD